MRGAKKGEGVETAWARRTIKMVVAAVMVVVVVVLVLVLVLVVTCSFYQHVPRVAYSLEADWSAGLDDDEHAAGVRPQRAYDGVT